MREKLLNELERFESHWEHKRWGLENFGEHNIERRIQEVDEKLTSIRSIRRFLIQEVLAIKDVENYARDMRNLILSRLTNQT